MFFFITGPGVADTKTVLGRILAFKLVQSAADGCPLRGRQPENRTPPDVDLPGTVAVHTYRSICAEQSHGTRPDHYDQGIAGQIVDQCVRSLVPPAFRPVKWRE